MKIHYHRNFIKAYRKRIPPSSNLNQKFKQRLALFIKDPTNSTLRDHRLKGGKLGHRAFSVTGDMRVIYERVRDGVLLHDIGTHNQVY